MDAPKRYHSVQLDKSRCKGCTNCLMHCPTEAIRVRDGRAPRSCASPTCPGR